MPSRCFPLLVASGLSLLLVSACGTDSPSATSTTTPSTAVAAPTPTPSGTPAPVATPTSTLPPGVDQLIRFDYRDGVVTGPKGRVKVKRGSTLRILVTSDKADEVHLHGYDKLVDVAAGGTAQITVKATLAGVFELELEKRKVVLTRIQVQ